MLIGKIAPVFINLTDLLRIRIEDFRSDEKVECSDVNLTQSFSIPGLGRALLKPAFLCRAEIFFAESKRMSAFYSKRHDNPPEADASRVPKR